MNQKMNTSKKQNETEWANLRVRPEMKTKAVAKLKEINTKETGRNLKLDEMILFALERLSDSDVKLLRERSLSNSDRQEILRKRYSELYGPVTPEEYIGVTMTLAYAEFLREHGHIVSVA